MTSLMNTYNSQIPLGNIIPLQMHTDRHSEYETRNSNPNLKSWQKKLVVEEAKRRNIK